MNRKQSILLFCTLCLLIPVFIIYSIAYYKFSAGSAITKLQQAVIRNDAKTVAGIIKPADSKLKIDEKSIKSFIDYLNENPSSFSDLINTLHRQASSMGNKKDPGCRNYYLTLKKSKMSFLNFSNYYFEMSPYYVNLITNFPNTKLYVDNKYYAVSDNGTNGLSKRCGPFVQGDHNVRAVLETPLGTSQNSKDCTFITAYSITNKPYEYSCSINILDRFVIIYCPYADAELFVDGKDIGKLDYSDTPNYTGGFKLLGPLTADHSIKVYAERNFPWGTFKSDISDINCYVMDSYFTINPVNDEVYNGLKTGIADYNKNLNSSRRYLYSKFDRNNSVIYYDSKTDIYTANFTSMDYYSQNYGKGEESITNNYSAVYDIKTKKWTINKIYSGGT